MESIIDLRALVAGLKNKTLAFSADEPLHVCLNSDMSLLNDDEDELDEQDGLIRMRAKAYHDGVNLNGSKIEYDTFIDKSFSMYMRPILANVVQDSEGRKDFGAHDRRYYFDEDGNLIEECIEKPIGCITSLWFDHDPAQGVTRAIVDGCLWKDYAPDAVEILKERGQVDCSVELSIKSMRYEEDELILDDYFVMGLTLLGKDFEPGMAGSNATLAKKEFVTEPQKKDEDDQELLDTVEQEEAEALKKQQEEEERQRQEEEERSRGDADAVSAQEGPSMISEKPTKSVAKTSKSGASPAKESAPKEETESAKEDKDTKSDKDAEPSTLDAKEEKAPQSEDVVTNALVLESLNIVLTTDAKGETVYLSAYSGNPSDPIEGEVKQVALIDLETMMRFANEGKELLSFRKERARAKKLEIIHDDLYKPYLESAEFKEIAENIDTYSLDEVNHKCLAAFAKNKKDESSNQIKVQLFAAPNISPVTDDYRVKRYGSIFTKTESK